MARNTMVRNGTGTTFELSPNGDPCGRGWAVREVSASGGCWYRGDISPLPYKFSECAALLKRWYPGCEVKKCDH